MTDVTMPAPRVTELNRRFWQAARDHRLEIQRCDHCRHLRYPIAAVCPVCLGSETTWVALSGRGTVFARVTYHHAFDPALAEHLPYVVAIVQLDEGPRMISNLVGPAAEHAQVGDAVEVVFEAVDGDLAVPRFTTRAQTR